MSAGAMPEVAPSVMGRMEAQTYSKEENAASEDVARRVLCRSRLESQSRP